MTDWMKNEAAAFIKGLAPLVIARGEEEEGQTECDGGDKQTSMNQLGRRRCFMGSSRYDVRIRGGRGSCKSGRSKGGCVNFILQNKSNPNTDKGRWGQTI